jgi:hypothetical protein
MFPSDHDTNTENHGTQGNNNNKLNGIKVAFTI